MTTARKAIAATAAALVGAIGAALLDGSLTPTEVAAAAGVALVAGAGTYAAPPNAPRPRRRRRT